MQVLISHLHPRRSSAIYFPVSEGRNISSFLKFQTKRGLILYNMAVIKTFKITNELGLHARASAKIVNVSNKYKSKIFFERDGKEVNGKSLLGILTLACPCGGHITIRAEGVDADDAVESLGRLIEGKFGEKR